jgi:hypothetical protein
MHDALLTFLVAITGLTVFLLPDRGLWKILFFLTLVFSILCNKIAPIGIFYRYSCFLPRKPTLEQLNTQVAGYYVF